MTSEQRKALREHLHLGQYLDIDKKTFDVRERTLIHANGFWDDPKKGIHHA